MLFRIVVLLVGWWVCQLVAGRAFGQATDSLVVIRSVSVEGNLRTRTPIILREMTLSEGVQVARTALDDLIEADRRKISNTNLFVTTALRQLATSTPDSVDLRVEVKERWYFLALPVFQLADRNFNEWWYERNRDLRRTTYGLYLSYENVTGRADRLRLLAEFGFVPKYELSYSLPYINKAMTLGFQTGISYTTNKTLPYRTWNDKLDFFNNENLNRERLFVFATLTKRKRFYDVQSLDLRWNYTELSDTLARLNPNYLLDGQVQQQYFQLTYTYQFDNRDNVQYGLRGRQYGLMASKLGLLPSDQLNQVVLMAWYRKFTPLGERFYTNSGLRTRLSLPNRQPYQSIVGLGFRQDLVRGYELYVIDGQQFVLLQNELKYKLFHFERTFDWFPIRQFNTIPVTAYLNTFADVGYVRNAFPELSNTQLGNKLLSGVGVGLDLVTFYNIVYRFNYSLNSQGERGFFFRVGRSF